MIELRNT